MTEIENKSYLLVKIIEMQYLSWLKSVVRGWKMINLLVQTLHVTHFNTISNFMPFPLL